MQHLENLATPVAGSYDVVVAGGGASGLIAALSAQRAGASTLLVEHAGCLGGTGTYGMVAQWIGFFNRNRRVVAGIPGELADLVQALGGSDGFRQYLMAEASASPIPLVHFAFNPEVVKIACDQLVQEAGVHLRLHSRVVAPMLDGQRVHGVVVEDCGGRAAVSARVVIDATGDACVAHAAGVRMADPEVASLRERQPFTLMFRLSNVDVAAFRAIPRDAKRALALEGLGQGRIFWESLSFCSTPGNTDAICLMSRVSGFDATDPDDLTRAELEGRRQVQSILGFLREKVPGFRNAILAAIAGHIGVRETRRILGQYTLSEADILGGRRFDDAIALGAGPLDLHDPAGTGISLHVPEQPFEIPMRCLIPQDAAGLLVTGRAISATRSANGGARHMATAMALGEAAGVLAALSVRSAGAPVRAEAVRGVLRKRGALVSLDDAPRFFDDSSTSS
jgi:hypothetical protein